MLLSLFAQPKMAKFEEFTAIQFIFVEVEKISDASPFLSWVSRRFSFFPVWMLNDGYTVGGPFFFKSINTTESEQYFRWTAGVNGRIHRKFTPNFESVYRGSFLVCGFFLKSEPDHTRGGRSPIRLALFDGPTEGYSFQSDDYGDGCGSSATGKWFHFIGVH